MGRPSYVFTVTKTGSTALSSSVDYQTVDGTAVAPDDYTANTATTLSFGPSETTKQVTVLVNGDTTFEAERNVHGSPKQCGGCDDQRCGWDGHDRE